MYNGTLYLNNSGSKWVVYEKGKKIKISFKRDGQLHIRIPLFFEAWGNYSFAKVIYKNEKINVYDFKAIYY